MVITIRVKINQANDDRGELKLILTLISRGPKNTTYSFEGANGKRLLHARPYEYSNPKLN